MTDTPVTQDWIHKLTFMQQTVLLTAIRGPDGSPKYGPVKMLMRWYRRCILRSSLENGRTIDNPYDPGGGSFMGPSMPLDLFEPKNNDWRSVMHQFVGEYLKQADAMPHHFQLHFMYSVEILGYKHPDELIRNWWHNVYVRLVHDMHLTPETEQDMDSRLGDDREQWLKRSDPATSN